MGLYCAR